VNKADDPQPPAKAVDIDRSLIVMPASHNPARPEGFVMIRLATGSEKIANFFRRKAKHKGGRGAVFDRKTDVRFWDQLTEAKDITKKGCQPSMSGVTVD